MRIKRVYEPASKEDGCRILVDRLWPRGLSKENAKLDRWIKDIAPSDDLRNWFAHDPAKWEEFKKKYAKELEAKRELIQEIEQAARKNTRHIAVFGKRYRTQQRSSPPSHLGEEDF